MEESRIGVADLAYNPRGGGDLAGMAQAVAAKVFGRLGAISHRTSIYPAEEDILLMLEDGELDVVGGLVVRKELCDRFVFSIPDFVSGTVLIVPDGNPKGLITYADVKAQDARLAVVTGHPSGRTPSRRGCPRATSRP